MALLRLNSQRVNGPRSPWALRAPRLETFVSTRCSVQSHRSIAWKATMLTFTPPSPQHPYEFKASPSHYVFDTATSLMITGYKLRNILNFLMQRVKIMIAMAYTTRWFTCHRVSWFIWPRWLTCSFSLLYEVANILNYSRLRCSCDHVVFKFWTLIRGILPILVLHKFQVSVV